MGYVKIGNVFVPDSGKPLAEFVCRMCGTHLSKGAYEPHIRKCFSQNEAEVRGMSKYERLPEFYGGHDVERQEWLESPAGRAWFAKHTGEHM